MSENTDKELIETMDAMSYQLGMRSLDVFPTIIVERALYDRLYVLAEDHKRTGRVHMQPNPTQKMRRAFAWGRLTIEASLAE